jgi:putative two-component system response regulator
MALKSGVGEKTLGTQFSSSRHSSRPVRRATSPQAEASYQVRDVSHVSDLHSADLPVEGLLAKDLPADEHPIRDLRMNDSMDDLEINDFDISRLLPRRRTPVILVVDDQPSIAGLMSQLLLVRGYEVITASNVEQAEAEVRRQQPDLILSDVMMPGKSGYDFCRSMKENPATRLIPFVLITGLSDSTDKVRGIEAGADDFLNKPVLAEELIARVKSLLRLKEFTDELETVDSVLCTLGLIVEGRDPYTEGHCERLSVRAADLGRHLNLDDDSIIALKRGGYLHDLGKIAVPDEVLKKGSDLTPAEWLIMKLHPITGENICKPLRSLRLVLPIIRHHHEHFDGTGYPDGLAAHEIPVLPRILQVVDVYDALRTARSYKPAQTHDQAAQTMREEARRGLWDRELVDEYFSMLEQQRRVA